MNAQVKNRTTALYRNLLPVVLLCFAILPLTAQVPAASSSAPDPADLNMAPVNGDSSAQAEQQPDEPQQAPPPSSGIENESIQSAQQARQQPDQQPADQQIDQQTEQPADQSAPYDENQPNPQDEANYETLESNQPPPALPAYTQPPAPEPDYLWTPGYWGFVPAGYYWVPGVWVAAPWSGALWTPGYWGFYNGRYRFHHGYWGRYIGFYGGICYGFGYTGYGYYGGFWLGNHFFYNRAVNNLNSTRVFNSYKRTVVVNNINRISYNGGRGGLRVQPRPAEIAARSEPRMRPMSTQLAIQQQAAQNRQQFYNANRGRPAMIAAPQPVQADRGVQRPIQNPVSPVQRPIAHPMPAAAPQVRPRLPQPTQIVTPGQPQIQQIPTDRHGRPIQPGQTYSQPTRPEYQSRPAELYPPQPIQSIQQVRPQPEIRPASPTQPQPQLNRHPEYQSRPADPHPVPQPIQPRYMPEARPVPQAQPVPRSIPQYEPRPQPESRPAPQPQYRPAPSPESRPAPQPQYRPAPQPESRPASQQQQHQAQPNGGHPR